MQFSAQAVGFVASLDEDPGIDVRATSETLERALVVIFERVHQKLQRGVRPDSQTGELVGSLRLVVRQWP